MLGPMLGWLTGRTPLERTAAELYGRVVAAARQPAFYRAIGVPDTPEGRYELVVLHLFLALERLKGEGEKGAALSQAALECFVTDMDDCMREMGVGDLTVAKRVKRAAAGFYERAGPYRAALAAADGRPMADALSQYIVGPASNAKGPDGMHALGDYARASAARLAALNNSDALAGRMSFTRFEENAARVQL